MLLGQGCAASPVQQHHLLGGLGHSARLPAAQPPTREHFPEETLRNLPLGPPRIFSLFAFLSGSISRLLAPVSFHILLLVSHGVSQTDEQAREIPKNPRFCVFLRSAVEDILESSPKTDLFRAVKL